MVEVYLNAPRLRGHATPLTLVHLAALGSPNGSQKIKIICFS
jgi:hypothetical protein